MKRILLSICILLSALTFSSVRAAGHFGVGIETDNFNGTDSNLALSYFTEKFMASLQGSTQKNPRATFGTRFTQINVQAGLRHALEKTATHNLYFTYGIIGSDFIIDKPEIVPNTNAGKNTYTLGVYTGMDYTFTKNVVLSLQILPYSKTIDNLSGNVSGESDDYFNNASMMVTYLF